MNLPMLMLGAACNSPGLSTPSPTPDPSTGTSSFEPPTPPGETADGAAADSAADSGAPPDSSWDSGADTQSSPPTFEECFSDFLASPKKDAPSPDYDQFHPVVGEHCYGTNHQDIHSVERVVFLGDSITVGTPPTLADEYYRSLLADKLVDSHGLLPPSEAWETVNWLDGVSLVQESGDFASCAKWGARADDLMRDNSQLSDCMPEDQRHKDTLVVITVGGNDLANLTEGFIEGQSTEELWAQTEEMMQRVREAVEWLKDPHRFTGEVHVVFTNLYEFTDATGDVTSCPLAELAGFGAAVEDPALAEMVVWSMEQYMSIAVDTGSDMLFLLETFCGHGFNYDDPTGRCYRGKEAELWFDLSCIHPNPTGHAVIADMFHAVTLE